MAMQNSYRNQPYKPGQNGVYKLSRSRIELFMQCPRCFWLAERLKISRPSGPPFNINKTIDELLKKEFDRYRKNGTPHPLMLDNNIKAVPYQHPMLDTWRYNFTGVSAVHKETNFHIYGAIDDVWVDEEGELIVVDYKATSKSKDVDIDSEWQISYKRQMEIYQWLLRRNGFMVNNRGFFVYTNARIDVDEFNDSLEFRTKLIPYEGDDGWIDGTLIQMKACLEGDMPDVGSAAMGGVCEFCAYAKARTQITIQSLQSTKTGK